MEKCLVRLKSAETPTLAAGLQSFSYGILLTTEIPVSGDKVMFCALTVYTPNSKAQMNNFAFLIVFLFWFVAKLCTTSKTNKKVTLISV